MLLTAHLISNFLFPFRIAATEKNRLKKANKLSEPDNANNANDANKNNKPDNKELLRHNLTSAFIAMLVVGSINPLLFAFVAGQYFLIGQFSRFFEKGFWGFVFEQLAYLGAILVISAIFPPFVYSVMATNIPLYREILIILSGFIASVFVGSVFVDRLITYAGKELWSDKNNQANNNEANNNKANNSQASEDHRASDEPSATVNCEQSDDWSLLRDNGLADGGKLIGRLERALAFVLILFNQPASIGFIFTAKSILRFADIKNSTQRKQTEYIIIGTLASFFWAILVGFTTVKFLQRG